MTGDDYKFENINPLSGQGRLSFGSFLWSLFGAVVCNLVIYAVLRSLLISARTGFAKDRMMFVYILWFVLAWLGFAIVSNTFLKRWRVILGEPEINQFWKFVIRFSLLSPILGVPLTIATFLFAGRSLEDIVDEGARHSALLILVLCLGLGLGATYALPSSVVGLERIEFRNSVRPFVVPAGYDENPIPMGAVVKPVLALSTPSLRYVAWLAGDAIRTKILSLAVEREGPQVCRERLGYLAVEVQDCYFSLLRKMANEAPLVSPYLPLYFESAYRKQIMSRVQQEVSTDLMKAFAANMLVISNQLELLEPGPMFVERTQFLRPTGSLYAFASPEVPLVEAGQDFQRLFLVARILPLIESQMLAVRESHRKYYYDLAVNEATVAGQLRALQIRIDRLKRDPLHIGAVRN